MKKFLLVLLIIAATTSRVYADGEMWRNAGQACVFGGSVLAVTSIVVLYPAIAVGTNSIPVTSLILGNTLFGCGISAIGAAAAYGFGVAYDRIFGPSEIVDSPTAKNVTKTDDAIKSAPSKLPSDQPSNKSFNAPTGTGVPNTNINPK